MNKPFQSAAQNFEDVMLYRALGDVEAGFYIDVGAQDPNIDSVSKAFFDRGWQGIHIEPVPEYAERLRAARPGDTIIEAAASNVVGTTALTVFPMTGLSTADPLVAKNHIDRGVDHQPEPLIVSTVTLADVAAELTDRTVHWLKIDVEGHEQAVLEGWDPSLLRPWVIVVEATLPNDRTASYADWEPILSKAGYQCVYGDGLNRFYIEPSREDLAQALSCPPNPFDNVQLSRHSALCNGVLEEAENNLTEAEAHIETLKRQSHALTDELQLLGRELKLACIARDDLKHDSERWRAAYNGMLQSWSWRLTAPVRKVRDLLGNPLRDKRAPSTEEPLAEIKAPLTEAALSPEGKKWAMRLRQISQGTDS